MSTPAAFPELIVERARVVRVNNTFAWVHCESQAGCARCAAGEGCGGGLFARLLRGRLQELPVRLPSELRDLADGDTVLVGLSVTAVQNASLLMYGLPLAGLLAGAVLASLVVPSDVAALFGAAAGFVVGLGLARYGGERISGLEPVLLRRLSPGEPCPAGAKA